MKIIAKLLVALALLVALILRLGDDAARIASKLPPAAGRTADSASAGAVSEQIAGAMGHATTAKDAYDIYELARKSREPAAEIFAEANRLLGEPEIVDRFCRLVMDGAPDPVKRYQSELEAIGKSRGFGRRNLQFLTGNALGHGLERVAQSLLFKHTLERTLGTPGYDLETLKRRHPLAAGLFPWGERMTEEFASQAAHLAKETVADTGEIDLPAAKMQLAALWRERMDPPACSDLGKSRHSLE